MLGGAERPQPSLPLLKCPPLGAAEREYRGRPEKRSGPRLRVSSGAGAWRPFWCGENERPLGERKRVLRLHLPQKRLSSPLSSECLGSNVARASHSRSASTRWSAASAAGRYGRTSSDETLPERRRSSRLLCSPGSYESREPSDPNGRNPVPRMGAHLPLVKDPSARSENNLASDERNLA